MMPSLLIKQGRHTSLPNCEGWMILSSSLLQNAPELQQASEDRAASSGSSFPGRDDDVDEICVPAHKKRNTAVIESEEQEDWFQSSQQLSGFADDLEEAGECVFELRVEYVKSR